MNEQEFSVDPLVNKVYKLRKKSDAFLGQWRDFAEVWYDLVANKQWTTEEKAALEEKKRIPVQFNRVASVVNAICGSEVSNRQEVKYLPRTIGDVNTNDILNAAAQWARDETNAEDEESDAFRDLVICGYGWTETYMSYDENVDGKVCVFRRNPLTMRYDPDARRRNIADATWVQADEYLTEEKIVSRWGQKKFDEIGMMKDPPVGETKPHDASRAWEYVNDQSGRHAKEGLYTVIHHCWYETKKMYRALDTITQKLVEIEPDRYNEVKKLPEFANVKAVKFDKRVYKQAFICGNVVLEEGDAPCQCSFPYEAMTGYRNQTDGWFYGIVWPMQDPQKFANKFLSQLMHIFSSNAKGGLMYESGAIDNPRKFEQDWAKADSLVKVSDGAISQNRIKEKPLPPYPTHAENLLNFCVSSLPMTSGVNVELLGLANRQQAGVLESQRTKAALTILATMFDALRLYRKRQGKMMAYYIIEYLSDGRLIRITGNTGDMQYIPLMKTREFIEYDVVVDEAVNSRDVKERTWAVMAQLLPMIKGMGIPIPPQILDYSPLPTGLAAEWKQEIEKQRKNPAPDPMQIQHQNNMREIQAKAQAEIQVKQAEIQFEGQKAQQQGSEAMIAAETELQVAKYKADLDAQVEIEKAKIKAESEKEIAAIKAQVEAQNAMVSGETVLKQKEMDIGAAMNKERLGVDHDIALKNISETSQAMQTLIQAVMDQGKTQSEAVGALIKELQRKKKIIRDGNGRPVGVE
jgi:hypothetical protein